MAEYANGAESQEQLNEDMLSSMQGIYSWSADDGVLTQSLTGINLSTEAEVETNNILLDILASLKKISKNITITADSQPDTTLISSGKQVPHAEAPTAIQTNKQESQSDERTFKMIAKDLGKSLINPVEGFFHELADIFPKPIKLLSEMAIHPFKLMGKSLWGGAKGMLGFGAKKELEADDEPIGEIEDTPFDDTDSQSNFLDAEGNALLDTDGNALDISSTGGILLEDAGVSGDILSTLQSTNTFVGQIYNWLVAEGKERDRKDALSDADITDDGDKIAGASGLLGFGGGRKGDDKDEGGSILDMLGNIAPWIKGAAPASLLLSSKVRSLASKGINAVRGLGSRGINAIRGRGLNAAGSLIHTRGANKGRIIKTAATMATKTTAAAASSASAASAAGGAGRFAHLTKYPKLLKAAKRIPLIGPILAGGLAVKLLMSDASHDEKVKGIGGLLGGALGAAAFAKIGGMVGLAFGGVGAPIGAAIGALAGWLGGEWAGTKLAGFLMGDVNAVGDVAEKPNIPGGDVDGKMPSTLESVKPGLEKKVEQLYPTDDTTQTQKQAVKSTKKVDFFDKDWMGWSEIDREKVDLVSTHQLKMLLQAERDDIRPEDIKFIEDTIKARYVQSMEVDASVGDSIDMPTTLQDSVGTNLTKSLDDDVPLTDKGEVLSFADWLVNPKTIEKLADAPVGVTAEDLYSDYVAEVYSKKKQITDSGIPLVDVAVAGGTDMSATLQDSVGTNLTKSLDDDVPLTDKGEAFLGVSAAQQAAKDQGLTNYQIKPVMDESGEESGEYTIENNDALMASGPYIKNADGTYSTNYAELATYAINQPGNVDSRDVANRLQVTEESQTQSSAPVVISDSSNKSTVVNNSTTTMALSVDSQDMVAAKLNFLLPGISYSH